MDSDLGQPTADALAAAWSRVDRARPRRRREVSGAVEAAREWVRAAIHLDGRLVAVLGRGYLDARASAPGGGALLGLHHVTALLDEGNRLNGLLLVSAGPEAIYWELYWRRYEDLPAPARLVPEHAEAYQAHLEGRPVRDPASAATAFLLEQVMPVLTSDG